MLHTVWATIKDGKIELLEPLSLPEGARLLVTLVPPEEQIDIREAYPLMDAVARCEGWDDPEMDSYDVYARKPQK